MGPPRRIDPTTHNVRTLLPRSYLLLLFKYTVKTSVAEVFQIVISGKRRKAHCNKSLDRSLMLHGWYNKDRDI